MQAQKQVFILGKETVQGNDIWEPHYNKQLGNEMAITKNIVCACPHVSYPL